MSGKRSASNHILHVKCVIVEQKSDESKFTGSMCKDPPLKIRFHEENVPMVKVVKSLLRFVNKSFRMKDVKEVQITQAGKKTKVKGDKIEGSVDLSGETLYDEVKILL